MELYDSKAYTEEVPSFDEIFRTYCYCMYLYLDQFYYELHERIDSPYILQYGIMLIHEVFTISLLHTRNIQTTKKAVEQSIQYYKEYLGQIYSQFLKLNPTDAYRFVLKRTLQLIPLHQRQSTNEQNNDWFIEISHFIELWIKLSTYCIFYHRNNWLSYKPNEMHKQHRSYFNNVTDIIQEICKIQMKPLKKHREWIETVLNLELKPEITFHLINKYLNSDIDLCKFREHWNLCSNNYHSQIDILQLADSAMN
jgi:hypothetical protein